MSRFLFVYSIEFTTFINLAFGHIGHGHFGIF